MVWFSDSGVAGEAVGRMRNAKGRGDWLRISTSMRSTYEPGTLSLASASRTWVPTTKLFLKTTWPKGSYRCQKCVSLTLAAAGLRLSKK